MEIFKQLNKKGYKHYYGGTIEELDCMDKNNPDLYSEIMQVIMWLYEKYNIWISVDPEIDTNTWFHTITHNKSETVFGNYSTLTEAYEKGIEHVINNLI